MRTARTVTRNRAPQLPAIGGASWRDDAACRNKDSSLWDFDFPDLWRIGVTICETICPVKDACLQAAQDEEADAYGKHGRAMIRGGLTPNQRGRLADGKPVGQARNPPPAPEPPWPLGAPCRNCGRPCAGDLARRRDPSLRDQYLRHVGRGLCSTCWRSDGSKIDVDAEARDAHRRFNNGHSDPETRHGERRYQAARGRIRRARARADRGEGDERVTA